MIVTHFVTQSNSASRSGIAGTGTLGQLAALASVAASFRPAARTCVTCCFHRLNQRLRGGSYCEVARPGWEAHMAAVANVLIVGAAPAGLSSAIALRRAGIEVEIVESSATRDVPGSELMIGGAFLRALDALGVVERCVQAGIGLDRTTLCSGDGQVLAEVAMPRVATDDLPLAAGITRKNLLDILLDTAEGLGCVVRYGTTVDGIKDDA